MDLSQLSLSLKEGTEMRPQEIISQATPHAAMSLVNPSDVIIEAGTVSEQCHSYCAS